jgi:hypothetical protein
MDSGSADRVEGMVGPPATRRWPSRQARVFVALLMATAALLLLVGGTSFAAGAGLPAEIIYSPAVATVISQVSTETLEVELGGLTGEWPVTVTGSLYTMTTRNTDQAAAISMATRYAYEQFAGYGLTVTFHEYDYGGGTRRNVVAEKPGLLDPDQVYLITAHLDSMPTGLVAPGADDNGSGSVAVLMAARLLAPHGLVHTVRFVLFTGEEQGLVGSAAYAADCKARGDDIRGVVNLDMIAYNSPGKPDPIIDLHASSSTASSVELAGIFSDVVGVYGLDLTPNLFVDSSLISRSDQWRFLQQGYAAFLAIEDGSDLTPYYHRTTDRLSTLDLDYYADFTRAGIATIAHLGRLGEGLLSGTVESAETGYGVPGIVGAVAPAPTPAFTCATDAEGAYSLLLPEGRYTITVQPTWPGYYAAVVTDVLVVSQTVTVQDVALEPWPNVYALYLPRVARE